jgi:hypothetical protein
VEIVRELTEADLQMLGVSQWERRGGRPADRDLNQELVEGWIEARGRMSKQAFVRKWFKGKHGRDAELEDVARYERRLNRLLLRPKSRPTLKNEFCPRIRILK